MTETFRTSLYIEAEPEAVFDHFVKPELLVRWMGDYARLEAVRGGVFSVDINGVLIRGEFLAVDRPSYVEISWGQAGNEVMPPGATRLAVHFKPVEGGTMLELEHSGLSPAEAARHAIGWPHFLDRLKIAAAGGDPGPDPWAVEPPHPAA
ncbi:SRPBCC family protein [Dongia deserti]|uniref:SRPBCC family protein n=1 Tax=Dongia deserti TaxID=2268030 RepID=UPI000E64F3B6|nr:SRPBCC domain-containing protein [Dongia deserti]